MNRRRKVALAIVFAVVVVVAVLGLRRRGESESPALSRSPTTTTRSALNGALASPSGADDAARASIAEPVTPVSPQIIATSAGLRVRSAEGLALKSAEIEDEPGRWRRVELALGLCELGETRLPCRVRAPGHVAATAIGLDSEVVLEADALLVFEGSDLRGCVDSIEPFPWLRHLDTSYAAAMRESFARVETHGFTSANRWAIAVSGDGLGESFGHERKLEVHIEDRTYRLIVAEFQTEHGARGSWTVPCTSKITTAPLELSIVRPDGGARGELTCAFQAVDSNRESLVVLPQSWGKVALQPGLRFHHEVRVAAGDSSCRVERVPLGERVIVTVLDSDSRANGRLFFVHDGTPRSITLHAGFTLAGRIAVPSGSELPTRMRLSFGRPGGSSKHPDGLGAFSSRLRDVEIGPDGSFEVRGPQRVPPWDGISADPPAILGVKIEATGFDLHASRWPLGFATRVDCGTLLLVPSYTPIVLAQGHGLTGTDLHWKALRTGPGGNAWNIRCGRLEPDGSMSLVFDDEWLARNEPGSADAEVAAARVSDVRSKLPVADSVPALVVDIDSDWGRAFVSGADGRYERVEEREYTIEVAASAVVEPDSKLTLGWRWRGIPQRLTTLGPGRASQRNTLRFTAPRDGVRLWWTSAPSVNGIIDRDAKSVELESASATIEIP